MNHEELDVWKKSIELVEIIYKVTNSFPKEELYCLTSQIRKSCISIPSNIAEGSARMTDKELIRFLYISLGSTAELETQILIAKKLNYIQNTNEINNSIIEIKKMTVGLIKYLRSK